MRSMGEVDAWGVQAFYWRVDTKPCCNFCMDDLLGLKFKLGSTPDRLVMTRYAVLLELEASISITK